MKTAEQALRDLSSELIRESVVENEIGSGLKRRGERSCIVITHFATATGLQKAAALAMRHARELEGG